MNDRKLDDDIESGGPEWSNAALSARRDSDTCVRWYVAYQLALRHVEDMMAERGVSVDHKTVNRLAIKRLPGFEKALRRCKPRGGKI